MLSVEEVDVFYGDLQALRRVSLQVKNGEVVSVIGANGAGKTTLLMSISGINKPKRGRIYFKGMQIDKLSPSRIVELGISQIPEGRQIFSSLTVLENLEMGAYVPKAKANKRKTLRWIFNLFPLLEERLPQIAGTLSGGEQQMLAIGRSLMSLPEMLMVDEPSLGLSPLLVNNVFEVLKKINESGTTILLVEQNIYFALKFSHRAYVIENGTIVLTGNGEDLLKDSHIKNAYLGI